MKAYAVLAVLPGLQDFGVVVAFEGESGGGGFLAGPEEAPPATGFVGRVEEKAFYLASAGALSVESGFEYGCVVAEVACIGWKEVADFAEMRVRDLPGLPVHHHEAGVVAPGRGFLGDPVGGQVVVEESGIHARKGVVLFLRLSYSLELCQRQPEMSKQTERTDWQDLAGRLARQMGGVDCLHPRVRACLEAADCRRVLVAVSGGADSVCLLCLLWSVRERFGIELVVGHYNHGWRGAASEADAGFVESLAGALGCLFQMERCVDGAVSATETAARELRLDFLRRTASGAGCCCIAFGHQANDVLETQLLRLARGSGTEGLAAPRPVHVFAGAPTHLRPLLGISSESIRRGMDAAGLPWREDVTNENVEIARNALRHEVVPVLSKSLDRDLLTGAARSQCLLEEDAAALRGLAEERFPDAFSVAEQLDRAELRAAPVALARRALAGWLQGRGLMASVGAASMDLLLVALRGEGEAVRQSVGEVFVVSDGKSVRVESAEKPLPAIETMPLAGGGRVPLPNGALLSAARVEVDEALRGRLAAGGVDPAREAWLASGAGETLTVRGWEPGDRFQPLGAPGAKKLKDWFIGRRIPQRERRALPVVLDSGGGILWVPGLPPSDSRKILKETKEALRLTYEPPNPT